MDKNSKKPDDGLGTTAVTKLPVGAAAAVAARHWPSTREFCDIANPKKLPQNIVISENLRINLGSLRAGLIIITVNIKQTEFARQKPGFTQIALIKS